MSKMRVVLKETLFGLMRKAVQAVKKGFKLFQFNFKYFDALWFRLIVLPRGECNRSTVRPYHIWVFAGVIKKLETCD